MIPAGRIPVGTADVSKRLGRKTLPSTVIKTLPAPISRPGAKTSIWDSEQIEAHLAGLPIPELPTAESPDDLLDREEARLQLGDIVEPETWRGYVNRKHAPEADKVVCGVPHWKRSTIRNWDANRPGAGAGGGRPKGVKDSRPRDRAADPRLSRADARKERVRAMLKDASGELTPAQVAEAESMSERQAYRLIKDLRAGQ
ncbi:hypothetical protein [Streptomyces sp. NPDC057429]|uniref:hypothetical protein n=1 Tax=Streptomyces sp. NPDC057429 TaxID=3346130 RepID=UPI0036B13E79